MITSTSNQKVKEIVQLQKKSALRKERDVYIVEGMKMFSEADPAKILQVYVSERFLESSSCEKQKGAHAPGQILDRCSKVETVSENVMAAMSDTKTPQGILCVMKRQHYTLEDMLQKPAPRLVFLENVRDPGNLGTILRTAEGAGFSGVLLSEGCVDIYNPKTIRSTMGSLYRVPFLYVKETDKVLDVLREQKLPVYGAALSESVSYETLSYKNGCVFLIGNEANGLSEQLLAKADCAVRIPMEGKVESLNAAVAASVLMYEAYRQVRVEGCRDQGMNWG